MHDSLSPGNSVFPWLLKSLRSALALAFHVALASCAATELLQKDTSAAEEISQTGFRRLIAENMKKIFADPESLG